MTPLNMNGKAAENRQILKYENMKRRVHSTLDQQSDRHPFISSYIHINHYYRLNTVTYLFSPLHRFFIAVIFRCIVCARRFRRKLRRMTEAISAATTAFQGALSTNPATYHITSHIRSKGSSQ